MGMLTLHQKTKFALATGTTAIHQNINSRDMAVLSHMLSLLPFIICQSLVRTIIVYSCSRRVIYAQRCSFIPMQHLCSFMPVLNLIYPKLSQLPGEAAIFITDIQVAAHAQTQCIIFRLGLCVQLPYLNTVRTRF